MSTESHVALIMGPGRTGKSTLARMIASERKAMWFSTDSIQWMLHRTAPYWTLPQMAPPAEKATALEKYLVAFLENTTYNHGLTFVEGDAILPSQLPMFDEHFGVAAALALVNTSATPESLVRGGGWASQLSPEELQRTTDWVISYSLEFQQLCYDRNIPCFDVGGLEDGERFVAALQNLRVQLDS